MKESSRKTGYFLSRNLEKNGLDRKDIVQLLDRVSNLPDSRYLELDISITMKFVFEELRDKYLLLNPKYEPSEESVKFNSSIISEIQESLAKLIGEKDSRNYHNSIKTIRENLIIEQLQMKIDVDNIDNTFLNRLRVVFKKHNII